MVGRKTLIRFDGSIISNIQSLIDFIFYGSHRGFAGHLLHKNNTMNINYQKTLFCTLTFFRNFSLSFGRLRRVCMVSRRMECGRLTPCNLKYKPQALQTISPRRFRRQMVVVRVPQFEQDMSFCPLDAMEDAIFAFCKQTALHYQLIG